MGIHPNQFPIIWQGIGWWLGERGFSVASLASNTSYSRQRIERGIRKGDEWIESDFLHDCVEFFGFQFRRGSEDYVEVLSDEECIELLTAPLRERPPKSRLFD